MIKRRVVYQIAGYDPVDAATQRRRFVRGLPTFQRTWNVSATASDLIETGPGAGRWTVTTRGPNWQVETTYVPLTWGDVVLADLAGPMPRRLVKFALALFDFVATGTAFRYVGANWKYFFFFLYPVLYLAAFAAAGYAAGAGIAGLAGFQGMAHALAVAAIGVALFFVLLHWLGRRWRVIQALDDWIFAWDYLHGRRPDMEPRLDRFAQELAAAASDPGYDEIVVVGHSLGATLAVAILARALDRDPQFGTRGAAVCLLTVGSTIPKFTLHPAADQVRRDVASVAAAPSVQWAEYHARADPISFYKFDPVSGTRVEHDRFESKPVIRLVRIRNMVSKETYRRIQLRFMRVHHQFVMANEVRTPYDFCMMGCGPMPFARTVAAMGGPDDLIAADGALVEPGLASAT